METEDLPREPQRKMLANDDVRIIEEQTTLSATVRHRRMLQTLFILATYFILGVLRGQEGVTFLDLLLTTNSNIERGSMLLTANALGYLAGCLLCGFLYDKFNNNIIFILSSVMTSLLTIIIPWCGYLPLMVVVYGLRSFFAGPVDAGSIVICARIWVSQSGPILQTLQFLFAVGGIVAPFVTNPFLLHTETTRSRTNISLHSNGTSGFENPLNPVQSETFYGYGLQGSRRENNSLLLPLGSRNDSASNGSHDFLSGTETTQVYVAFIISGGLLLVVAIIFTLTVARELLLGRNRMAHVETQRQHRNESYPTFMKMIGLALLGINCFAYGCVEKIWMSYLMTFLVELLGWTKTSGSVATAVFWGGFAGGAICGHLHRQSYETWRTVDF